MKLLTGIRRQCVVICAETEEEEERGKPYANPKESCNVTKVRHGMGLRAAVGAMSSLPCLLRYPGEVEEPEEVICDDKHTRGHEACGRQGYEGPCGGEVLKIDNVAEDGEEDVLQWEGVVKIQQEMD